MSGTLRQNGLGAFHRILPNSPAADAQVNNHPYSSVQSAPTASSTSGQSVLSARSEKTAAAPSRVRRNLSLVFRPAPSTVLNTSAYPAEVPSSTPDQPWQRSRVHNKTVDGDLETAPTLCWEICRDSPMAHVRICGHKVTTREPQECGPSCMTSEFADSRVQGRHIGCRQCIKEKKALNRSPLMAGKLNKRNILPRDVKRKFQEFEAADEGDGLFVEQVDEPPAKRRKTLLPAERTNTPARPVMRSRKVLQDNSEELTIRQLNEQIKHDAALAALARSTARGDRQLSLLHVGYACREEREATMREATLPGEIARLVTDGSAALHNKLTRKFRHADDSSFDVHDRPIMEPSSIERPHSYSQSAVIGHQSMRHQHAGMFSMPATNYDQMMEDEGGVAVEDFEESAVLQRDKYEFDDGESIEIDYPE